MTTSKDIDALAPNSEPLELSSGTTVLIERLKTRQLFKLMKILTAGAGSLLANLSFSSDTDPMEFAGQLAGLVFVAIPEAEDEAIEFVQAMVAPANLVQSPRTKADRIENERLWGNLSAELYNPEIDDLISIIERIVRNEAEDIQKLGKRLASLIQMNQAQDAAKNSSKSNTKA